MFTLQKHLNEEHGYTCQTWLSKTIADNYFGGKYRVWFATSINPTNNGNSSNPIKLYMELVDIVEKNDIHHSRFIEIKNRLISWIGSTNLHHKTKTNLISTIEKAPVNSFRPEIWKIDLSKIHINRLIDLGQYPDEYLIKNLNYREFKVMTKY